MSHDMSRVKMQQHNHRSSLEGRQASVDVNMHSRNDLVMNANKMTKTQTKNDQERRRALYHLNKEVKGQSGAAHEQASRQYNQYLLQ